VSDWQPAKELQARNVVAERIEAVLLHRRKIGVERLFMNGSINAEDNERAIGRYYRLNGEAVAHKRTAPQRHPEPVSQEVRDVHANKVAKPIVHPDVTYFRWNSVNGPTVW
jgi:hypothetical protein